MEQETKWVIPLHGYFKLLCKIIIIITLVAMNNHDSSMKYKPKILPMTSQNNMCHIKINVGCVKKDIVP